jgi:hypothetical protein
MRIVRSDPPADLPTAGARAAVQRLPQPRLESAQNSVRPTDTRARQSASQSLRPSSRLRHDLVNPGPRPATQKANTARPACEARAHSRTESRISRSNNLRLRGLRTSWLALAMLTIGTISGCSVPSDCMRQDRGDLATITVADDSIVPNGSRNNLIEVCISDECVRRQFDFDVVVSNSAAPQVDINFSDLELPDAPNLVEARVTIFLTGASDPAVTLSGEFPVQNVRTDCGADSLRLTLRSGTIEVTPASGRS